MSDSGRNGVIPLGLRAPTPYFNPNYHSGKLETSRRGQCFSNVCLLKEQRRLQRQEPPTSPRSLSLLGILLAFIPFWDPGFSTADDGEWT